MEETCEARYEEVGRRGTSCALWAHHPPNTSACSPTWKTLGHRLRPSPLSSGQEVGLKFLGYSWGPTFIMKLPRGPTPCRLINENTG